LPLHSSVIIIIFLSYTASCGLFFKSYCFLICSFLLFCFFSFSFSLVRVVLDWLLVGFQLTMLKTCSTWLSLREWVQWVAVKAARWIIIWLNDWRLTSSSICCWTQPGHPSVGRLAVITWSWKNAGDRLAQQECLNSTVTAAALQSCYTHCTYTRVYVHRRSLLNPTSPYWQWRDNGRGLVSGCELQKWRSVIPLQLCIRTLSFRSQVSNGHMPDCTLCLWTNFSLPLLIAQVYPMYPVNTNWQVIVPKLNSKGRDLLVVGDVWWMFDFFKSTELT